MTKVAINRCLGNFHLSRAAFERLADMGNEKAIKALSDGYRKRDQVKFDRTDTDLISVIEQLGDTANGMHAKIAIVEIPDDIKWHIVCDDGVEYIAEDHRTWPELTGHRI